MIYGYFLFFLQIASEFLNYGRKCTRATFLHRTNPLLEGYGIGTRTAYWDVAVRVRYENRLSVQYSNCTSCFPLTTFDEGGLMILL